VGDVLVGLVEGAALALPPHRPPERPDHKLHQRPRHLRKREFFIDNLLVRIHFIIVMIRWTGLAPWEVHFPFSGSLTSAPERPDHQLHQRPRHLPRVLRLQGYLAHKKQPPPLGPPYDPRYSHGVKS